MEKNFWFDPRYWTRIAVWGAFVAPLCLFNASCISPLPVGGPAVVEAYQWTGRGAWFPGAMSPLAAQAKALSTQPSPEGEVSALNRIITVPFYVQDKGAAHEDSPPNSVYELLDPVVLVGGNKRFDYAKRYFVRILIHPMYAIPMDPPPGPGALVFAEGAWPVCACHNGGSAASWMREQAEAILLRTVHYPLSRAFDYGISESAGCGRSNMRLVGILDKQSDRLFRLIDKSRVLSEQDRRMIYQQLTKLAAEGAMQHLDSAMYPTYREVLKRVLPELQAKAH